MAFWKRGLFQTHNYHFKIQFSFLKPNVLLNMIYHEKKLKAISGHEKLAAQKVNRFHKRPF